MTRTAPRTIDDLLHEARRSLTRLSPHEALAAQNAGALLVDTRSAADRLAEGGLPGAVIIERTVLEWRLDPASETCLPFASHDLHVVVVCNDGYSSSLAAATLQRLGIRRATDVEGGFRAWRSAGLPTDRPDVRFILWRSASARRTIGGIRHEEAPMARYVTLVNWTPQGAATFRDTLDRAAAADKLFGSFGGSMVEVYWTLGPYDIVAIGEFPDDETATAAMLRLAEQGNVRTTTMRAFDRAGMAGILAKAGG